jgi:ATP-dependent Clp protease ATP-binding subunit ClpX
MERTVASVPPQGGRKHPQQDKATPPTFVCGAVFGGLEKSSPSEAAPPRSALAPRWRHQRTAKPETSSERSSLRYGLIPESVGRLPVLDLDEPTLKRILVEPKNALVKQYHRLLEMESIELSFAEEALSAIAPKGDRAQDRCAQLALHHGRRSARHHVC